MAVSFILGLIRRLAQGYRLSGAASAELCSFNYDVAVAQGMGDCAVLWTGEYEA